MKEKILMPKLIIIIMFLEILVTYNCYTLQYNERTNLNFNCIQ